MLGIAAEVGHPRGEVQNGAVRDDNALRRAGGAGGEEDIDRVNVQDLFAPRMQKRGIRLVRGGFLQ